MATIQLNRTQLLEKAAALGIDIPDPDAVTKAQITELIEKAETATPVAAEVTPTDSGEVPPSLMDNPNQAPAAPVQTDATDQLVQPVAPVTPAAPETVQPDSKPVDGVPVAPVNAELPTAASLVAPVDPAALPAQDLKAVSALALTGEEQTIKKLSGQSKVAISIPFEKDDQPGAKYKMKINGVAINIPKGEIVMVPADVAAQYNDSYRQVTFAARSQKDKARTF